jgi:hypothetical protein
VKPEKISLAALHQQSNWYKTSGRPVARGSQRVPLIRRIRADQRELFRASLFDPARKRENAETPLRRSNVLQRAGELAEFWGFLRPVMALFGYPELNGQKGQGKRRSVEQIRMDVTIEFAGKFVPVSSLRKQGSEDWDVTGLYFIETDGVDHWKTPEMVRCLRYEL